MWVHAAAARSEPYALSQSLPPLGRWWVGGHWTGLRVVMCHCTNSGVEVVFFGSLLKQQYLTPTQEDQAFCKFLLITKPDEWNDLRRKHTDFLWSYIAADWVPRAGSRSCPTGVVFVWLQAPPAPGAGNRTGNWQEWLNRVMLLSMDLYHLPVWQSFIGSTASLKAV